MSVDSDKAEQDLYLATLTKLPDSAILGELAKRQVGVPHKSESPAEVRDRGRKALEGLNHLGFTALEARLTASLASYSDDLDLTRVAYAKALQEAYGESVRLMRDTDSAAQEIGRAPYWCGVCRDVSDYRNALMDLMLAAEEYAGLRPLVVPR